MSEKIAEIRELIIRDHLEGMQTFKTKNIVGDEMTQLYNKNGVTIEICIGCDYLEIIGLTEEEYQQIADLIDLW